MQVVYIGDSCMQNHSLDDVIQTLIGFQKQKESDLEDSESQGHSRPTYQHTNGSRDTSPGASGDHQVCSSEYIES